MPRDSKPLKWIRKNVLGKAMPRNSRSLDGFNGFNEPTGAEEAMNTTPSSTQRDEIVKVVAGVRGEDYPWNDSEGWLVYVGKTRVDITAFRPIADGLADNLRKELAPLYEQKEEAERLRDLNFIHYEQVLAERNIERSANRKLAEQKEELVRVLELVTIYAPHITREWSDDSKPICVNGCPKCEVLSTLKKVAK